MKKLSKADEMLLEAKTAEETIKALEMGANVNAYYEDRGTGPYSALNRAIRVSALYNAHDEAQVLVLLRAGANIDDFEKNYNFSFKKKIQIILKFKKEQQIEAQKKRIQKSQEHLAELKGEKTTPTKSPVSNSASSKPNGRGGNGGNGGFGGGM